MLRPAGTLLPEKRKVGSSTLPLTTGSMRLSQPAHLRICQGERIPMALSALILKFSDLRKRSRADACAPAEPQEERKTMPIPQPRPRRPKPLEAGPFAPEIGSFRLTWPPRAKPPRRCGLTPKRCNGSPPPT